MVCGLPETVDHPQAFASQGVHTKGEQDVFNDLLISFHNDYGSFSVTPSHDGTSIDLKKAVRFRNSLDYIEYIFYEKSNAPLVRETLDW